MNSLQKLLAEEGLRHSNFLKTKKKQINVGEDGEQLPKFICHDLKSLNQTTNKPSNRNGSSVFSSERFNTESESGEAAIDAAAVKALVSILTGYIGRYGKDSTFRQMIKNKCRDCLVPKRKDFNDGVFANFDLGIESIERLIENSVSEKELRVKSVRDSIQLFSSLNSKKSKRSGVPNSQISACAQLYLSIVYKLEKNDRVSAWHLLQVFRDSPFLARTHLLPDLWEHLFLPHLLHLKIWHHKEIESISVSNRQDSDKDKRFSALNKAYNGSLDIGTIQFAMYYREWLKFGGKAPPVPMIPLPLKPSFPPSRRISADFALPSKLSFAPSRRISSDSYTSSHSSIDRSLYLAVFGPTPEHSSVEFDSQKRDFWIQEDGHGRVNYVADKVKSHRRSSSEDFKTDLRSERPKSLDYFSLFSCQSVVSECLVKGKVVRTSSIRRIPNSDIPLSDLSRSIHTLSSSDSLTDCETAIRFIAKAWIDSHDDPLIEAAISKAPVLEGILEVLFASDDDEVLELGISVLAEFVARNEANRLVVLNADPQLEIFTRLLKSSSLFLKAAVLLYQLKPKAKQMISIEWVALALRVLEFGEQLQTLFTVRCMPQKAAMYFLDQLLTGFNEDHNLENASQVVSLGGLSFLLRILEKGEIQERSNAVVLMCCCIRADSNCRDYLAEHVNKASVLELVALGVQKKSSQSALGFLTELLCLNRRTRATEFLTELNRGWNGLNTMHIFLVYLQRASPEERPLVAAILLQLDLLGDPLKTSLYREDAVEAIIESLDSGISNPRIQEESAKALSMLGGRFLCKGEMTMEEWFLQESVNPYSSNEDEMATKDWQRKAAIVLLNTGSKRFLDALSNSIANGIPSLAQSCLFTVAWMNRVLLSADNENVRFSACSRILKEQPESLNFDTTLDARTHGSGSLQRLIKNAGCMTMLATLDKELIHPLQNP